MDNPVELNANPRVNLAVESHIRRYLVKGGDHKSKESEFLNCQRNIMPQENVSLLVRRCPMIQELWPRYVNMHPSEYETTWPGKPFWIRSRRIPAVSSKHNSVRTDYIDLLGGWSQLAEWQGVNQRYCKRISKLLKVYSRQTGETCWSFKVSLDKRIERESFAHRASVQRLVAWVAPLWIHLLILRRHHGQS